MTTAEKLAAQFDHQSQAQMSCPFDMYSRFRTECPIGHSENYGGFWFASRYDDVVAMAKNFRKFSSRDGTAIPKQPTTPMYPIDVDPPLHTEFRTVLAPLFHKDRAEALAPQVEAEVDRLLDGVVAAGECDLAVVCRELPPIFALRLIGVPDAAARDVRKWIDVLTHERNIVERAQAAGANLAAYLMQLVAQRRNEPRGDDVLSLLLDCNVAGMGGALDDEAIYRVLVIVLFGGLDTSTSAMLESLLYLSRNPADKQHVIAHLDDAAFWEVAIEELVRYVSPIQGLKRQLTTDVEMAGAQMHAGDDVMLLWGSANRDESHFAQADRIVWDRAPNPHLGFGMGAHRCLGMHYGRVFLRSVLKRVLARIPDYRVADDFEPAYVVGEGRGIASLPVRFTPADTSLICR